MEQGTWNMGQTWYSSRQRNGSLPFLSSSFPFPRSEMSQNWNTFHSRNKGRSSPPGRTVYHYSYWKEGRREPRKFSRSSYFDLFIRPIVISDNISFKKFESLRRYIVTISDKRQSSFPYTIPERNGQQRLFGELAISPLFSPVFHVCVIPY